ncbi:MAG TPA: hypothetical protein VMN39_09495 [Longimicrobiaceae bacterium]|nr:hypothetical protein [Longimicrobiaceae bacterium]
MKSILLSLLLTALAGTAAFAQQAEPQADEPIEREVEAAIDRGGLGVVLDSIARDAAPGLEDALGDLATELEAVANRIANDPELRMAALRTAGGLLQVAQVALEAHAEQVQEALREMADRLDDLTPTDREPTLR